MNTALARRAPATLTARDLEELRIEAKRLVEPPHAKETRRRYAREVRTFRDFCAAIGAEPLPASHDTMVLYLAQMKARGRTAGGIDAALTAISTWHKAAGHNSPRGMLAVQVARENIRREIGVKPEKKAPLRVPLLLRAIERIDAATLIGKRDIALLLVGFAGAFRRSELVGLDIGDIAFCPEGVRVDLRRSKTDQLGRGRTKAIPHGAPGNPVEALRTWLDATGRTDGPLFCAVDRWGNQDVRRLDGRTVARVVKRRIDGLGPDVKDFAGHSLRRGLVSEATAAGKSRHKIKSITGHRSDAMLEEYIEDAELFRDNAADGLGQSEEE